MPKRLIWFGVVCLAYLAICFSVHLLLNKSTLQLSSYKTMVASLSGRIHESMSESDVQHLSSQITKIERGGDLRALGLNFEARPLSFYLSRSSFNLSASLKLLNERRLRAAQVKFDSLSSKVETVYIRRIHLLSTLSKLAAVVGLALFLVYAWLWRRARGHWSNEIAVVDEGSSFESYLQSVLTEEIKFVGHRASLDCSGFDVDVISPSIRDAIEVIAEQFVRNSVEHGGRPAQDRLLIGKEDYISIRVTLQEHKDRWELSVWDNGEGIDGDSVLRRALELNLLSEASANALAVEERIKLIFLSGFTTRRKLVSTAENDKPLSELRVISKLLGGVISVQNQQGDYCQFSVRFPKS